MSSPLDIAGVAGTWAAVSLAIIGLVGVVGPLLAFQQQRNEHYIGINSVDDRRHDFVGRGFKLFFTPRLFQGIRVPDLSKPPRLVNIPRVRKDKLLGRAESQTGWVTFARLLNVYGLHFEITNKLAASSVGTEIPVHRLWLFAFGLLGRYGERPDKGHHPDYIKDRLDHRDLDESEETTDSHYLYGLTGRLETGRDKRSRNIKFRGQDAESQVDLNPDGIALETLFWLSLACLPMPDRRIFDVARGTEERNDSYLDGQSKQPLVYYFQEVDDLAPNSRYLQWAKAFGKNIGSIWTLQQRGLKETLSESDIEIVISEASLEYSLSRLLAWRDFRYEEQWILFRKADYQALSLAVLQVPISPFGVLFDHSLGSFLKSILPPIKDGFHDLVSAVGAALPEVKLPSLLKLDAYLRKNLAASSPSINEEDGDSGDLRRPGLPFDAEFLRNVYDLDVELRSAFSKRKLIPDAASKAVGVLFLTSKIFQETLRLWTTSRSFTANEKFLALDCELKRFIFPMAVDDLNKEVAVGFDFEEVFAGQCAFPAPVYFGMEDTLLLCLQAWIHKALLDASIDSAPLIKFIKALPANPILVDGLPELMPSEIHDFESEYSDSLEGRGRYEIRQKRSSNKRKDKFETPYKPAPEESFKIFAARFKRWQSGDTSSETAGDWRNPISNDSGVPAAYPGLYDEDPSVQYGPKEDGSHVIIQGYSVPDGADGNDLSRSEWLHRYVERMRSQPEWQDPIYQSRFEKLEKKLEEDLWDVSTVMWALNPNVLERYGIPIGLGMKFRNFCYYTPKSSFIEPAGTQQQVVLRGRDG
ncbi:MAG: hypothetical protein M1821_009868 [Bathelium mastoideum]|nr:MAG: hypothetical protein M1821_009868 [Bathelium mastoideum]